jgi:uncharacterized membrane protein
MTAVATGIRDSRTPRWLMPVLVGSLALNLIVIGAAGSLLWRGQLEAPGAPPLGRRVVANIVGYAATLPPARIRELEERTKVQRQKAWPLRRALLSAREEVNKALVAEPFDRARFLAAWAAFVKADELSRAASFELQSAIALHLTPEERRGFLNWREKQRLPQNPLDAPEQPPGEPPQK